MTAELSEDDVALICHALGLYRHYGHQELAKPGATPEQKQDWHESLEHAQQIINKLAPEAGN